MRQLKIQLKSIKEEGNSASKYLLKIKKIVDSLAAIGAPISTEEQIEVILDGLNEDYNTLITAILARSQPFSINELKALLMAQEEMLERFKKYDIGLVQANLAQSTIQDQKNTQQNSGSG